MGGRSGLVAIALGVAMGCGATHIEKVAPVETAPPTDPAPPTPTPPLDAAACAADRNAAWPIAAPASCSGKRSCLDARGRFWVDGKPFVPRGVYNGGWEYSRVLSNCPDAAPCSAWNPKDLAGYVKLLADAGFNLIQERSRNTPELVAAVHGEPRMRIAHLLWSDPFTQDGHDAMVADVKAAAADPSVVMWFGPDESDRNASYPMSAGIRRILRGDSVELQKLLVDYPPAAGAYLPAGEPAADSIGMPYSAALAYDRGLAVGRRFYDTLMPITYPFEDDTSAANTGDFGTQRSGSLSTNGAVLPVLQMIGIAEQGLAQPSRGQVRAEIASSIANGAVGAFYYTLTSDKPSYAGRSGWFAADDRDAWAAFTEMHALEDALAPVLFSDATQTAHVGADEPLEWRIFRRPDGRRVAMVVNPGAKKAKVDLAGVLGLAEGESVRSYLDCSAIDPSAETTLAGYEHLLVEVVTP